MYECTYPFWVIAIGIGIILAILLGFSDFYILKSELPSMLSTAKKGKNELIEIKAKSRFNSYAVTFIFIIPTILAVVLFLWQYFSFHPITSELLSIISSIAIFLATIILGLFALAAQILIFVLAELVHTRMIEKKCTKIYGRKAIITFPK